VATNPADNNTSNTVRISLIPVEKIEVEIAPQPPARKISNREIRQSNLLQILAIQMLVGFISNKK
jgi:hypothetical protein